MDPTTCYLDMIQFLKDRNINDAVEHAYALRDWLHKDGFLPTGANPDVLYGDIERVIGWFD